MRKRLNEQARRELLTRQSSLTALSKHPSWPDLEATVEEKAAKVEKIVLANVFGTGMDERTQAYYRGFVHGMRWFASVPTQAEASLEDYLRKQGLQVQREVETT